MAQPTSVVVEVEIVRYDVATQVAMRDEHVPQLNPEQRAVYDNVMAVIDRRAFFVDEVFLNIECLVNLLL